MYVGRVMHQRVRPKRHLLRYRTWSLLLDLDELPELSRRLRFFSHNRANLFSTRDSDYGDGGAQPLRAQVEAHMRAAGLAPDGGAIRLLTMPRLLGYAFNPISVYYCHARSGALRAMLYEVNNTFGQRHSYFIPVEAGAGARIRQSCAKKLYVSPFMPMAMTYDFFVSPPGEALSLRIVNSDADGVVMTASQEQRRVALSDAALLKVFVTHPLLTVKVIGGIHFEAMLLWLKGLRVQDRPSAPRNATTLVAPARERERAIQ
jgi:DUF1365 family protein